MNTLLQKNTIIFLAATLVFVGCRKKYDTPPLDTIPNSGNTMTISELRTWQATEGGTISIDDEVSVHGIITMDETDGNIYKNVYMQDQTGAVNVRMLNGGGIYQGDSVRIYLRGAILSKYNGVLQIDSIDVDRNIEKLATNKPFAPEITGIDFITSAKESQLIQLNNVQFIKSELGKTFADGENLVSEDRILEDEDGNIVKVRTSGYAAFADENIPTGSGSIVCVVSHFNGQVQLLIRSFREINMTAPRFQGLVLSKDFDDGEVTSGGWIAHKVIGEIDWETSSAGGAPNDYGVISNYISPSNYETENWLISPSVNLSGGGSPYINFDNACNYSGPALELFISADYDGISNPTEQGTWTNLSGMATLSSGSFTWVNSTNIATGVTGSNIHIAFKYTGTASTGRTWELDNIIIHE